MSIPASVLDNNYVLYICLSTHLTDNDECADTLANDCTQQCINIPGSYECDCYDGYQAVTVNATQCEGTYITYVYTAIYNVYHCTYVDINECEGYNDCHQNCTNADGSYYCSCDTGFVLAADSRTCQGYYYTCNNNFIICIANCMHMCYWCSLNIVRVVFNNRYIPTILLCGNFKSFMFIVSRILFSNYLFELYLCPSHGK